MEKPKRPRFSVDVREYAIFRADLKHAIEMSYSNCDCLTYLHACLQGRPLELIKGIVSDYDAAWEYLDSIYADPRFVSDTITQDIVKLRPIRDGEDARFGELVHLVKRCYNTLQKVGLPSDMDNSHMLSINEQTMCVDDRNVWSRHLKKTKQPATLLSLMTWMTAEMNSAMRATAPIRISNTQLSIHYVATGNKDETKGISTNAVIDENLSWNMHIEKIAEKIASGIGAIKRCRPFVNRTTLESVFNALVQPYFNYCSEVWGHCNKSLSNKLQKLQNRAARILTFSSYDTSADPLLEQLNWKRLDTQRQIQVATMVYKSIHGLAPDYLGSLFTKYNPPYNLRNSEDKLAVPLPRTNFLKNSFSYNGAVIWNSLPPELRQAKSLKSFRNGCRDFFD